MSEAETVHYERTGDAVQDGLDHLNHLVTEAEAARIDARHDADAATAGAINNARVKALRDYHDGVLFRKRNADPDEESVLVGALCSEISQNKDLTLVALGASRFRVDDVGPARRLREAEANLREATQARDEFLREHAGEIEAAKRQAESDAVFASLKSGDPERIREALSISFQPTKALTTTDLAG